MCCKRTPTAYKPIICLPQTHTRVELRHSLEPEWHTYMLQTSQYHKQIPVCHKLSQTHACVSQRSTRVSQTYPRVTDNPLSHKCIPVCHKNIPVYRSVSRTQVLQRHTRVPQKPIRVSQAPTQVSQTHDHVLQKHVAVSCTQYVANNILCVKILNMLNDTYMSF